LRELANTHPRINLLESGPGVGGYCLPNALKYILLSLDEEKRKDMKLMNTARESNSQRPGKIVSRVNEILKENGKDIKQAKIAVIGLAMKDYCADYRYSPALEIIELLQKAGAKVVAYDSLVPKEAVAQACTYLEAITAADCMIITAKQRKVVFDPVEISKAMNKPAIVIDTRNAVYSHPDIYLYKV
jgi:UDP-N-acetyl-D-mannosaminuronic acid dehydrogenase